MVINPAVALMLVSMAVALLPVLSRRLRIPSAVAEILFGVILGQSLLQLQFGGDWLPFLAQLGFLLLLFQAGMEIDFTALRLLSRGQLLFQLGVYSGTISLSFLFAALSGQGLFLGFVLSTTSLDLVLTTLKSSRLSRTALGQSLLVAASVADFLTLLGITFFLLWHQGGAGLHLISPLGLFAVFALLLWAARLWAWWNPERAERMLLSDNIEEQGVRFSLALLFLFVGISELVHIEPVLGAFLGGCIVSFVFREKRILESKISALGFGFLVPLFFIHVGMGFDLSNVLSGSQLLMTGLLLLVAVAVKVLPMALVPGSRLKLKERLRGGLLLSSRLSLIVAVAAIGVQEGFLLVETKDSVVLLALLTCLMGPVLFKLALGRGSSARGQ
jgi:Kef-type K+ transport system membrane component KefB